MLFFIYLFEDINHSLWRAAEPVYKEHKKASMESSWSVGMNMTYWVENRKKGSRNEEIKVEADEPDVRKTELILFFFWWKTEHEVNLIWLILNLRSASDAQCALLFQPSRTRWFSKTSMVQSHLSSSINVLLSREAKSKINLAGNRQATSVILS